MIFFDGVGCIGIEYCWIYWWGGEGGLVDVLLFLLFFGIGICSCGRFFEFLWVFVVVY